MGQYDIDKIRSEILDELDKLSGEPIQPGDITKQNLKDRYDCSETKALRIMRDAERKGLGRIIKVRDVNNREVLVLRKDTNDDTGMQEDGG